MDEPEYNSECLNVLSNIIPWRAVLTCVLWRLLPTKLLYGFVTFGFVPQQSTLTHKMSAVEEIPS